MSMFLSSLTFNFSLGLRLRLRFLVCFFFPLHSPFSSSSSLSSLQFSNAVSSNLKRVPFLIPEKNIERIINPILPPERSYQNTYGTPINIPSNNNS